MIVGGTKTQNISEIIHDTRRHSEVYIIHVRNRLVNSKTNLLIQCCILLRKIVISNYKYIISYLHILHPLLPCPLLFVTMCNINAYFIPSRLTIPIKFVNSHYILSCTHYELSHSTHDHPCLFFFSSYKVITDIRYANGVHLSAIWENTALVQ